MPNPLMDLLNDAVHSNSINLSRLDNLKATIPIILIITRSTQRRADTSMDIRIIGQQSLLRRMVEVRAVVDASYLAGRAAKDLWLPGIEMRVEVDD